MQTFRSGQVFLISSFHWLMIVSGHKMSVVLHSLTFREGSKVSYISFSETDERGFNFIREVISRVFPNPISSHRNPFAGYFS